MSTEQQVQRHFDADAQRFDAIYEDENKGSFSRWVDNVWRGVVKRRLALTMELLSPLEGKTILDVGCGSGRFCIAFAQQGVAKVVGVDFAQNMIDIANQLAEKNNVVDRCEFRTGTFPEIVPDGPFDASTALGVFDYVADPVALVRDMRSRTSQTMVMSFPKAWEWRVPIRRMRFWFNKCPLYLYSAEQVRRILGEAGIEKYDWINLDRDFLIVAHVATDTPEAQEPNTD